MQGIVKNSSLTNREQMLAQMAQMSQPNPQQQQVQRQMVALEARVKNAEAMLKEAQAEKARVEAQLAPDEARAKMVAALSNNLDDDQEGKDFERRARIAELMIREEEVNTKKADIASNERIARTQMDKDRMSLVQ